jgi:hypothetical protein
MTDTHALLGIVAEGCGVCDARRIDIIYSARHGAASQTTLAELERLREEGRVARQEGGVGDRWSLTEPGQAALAAGR